MLQSGNVPGMLAPGGLALYLPLFIEDTLPFCSYFVTSRKGGGGVNSPGLTVIFVL